jgi:hypothetical protein
MRPAICYAEPEILCVCEVVVEIATEGLNGRRVDGTSNERLPEALYPDSGDNLDTVLLEDRNNLIEKTENLPLLISGAPRYVPPKIAAFNFSEDAVEIVCGTVSKARKGAVFGVQKVVRQPFETILIKE